MGVRRVDWAGVLFKPRSYLAARQLARGEWRGWLGTLEATVVRALLTAPGLLVVGIPWQKALLGSFLGNVIVTITVVGYYLYYGTDQPDPTGGSVDVTVP